MIPDELCADLILFNCRAYTADDEDTIAEAVAVKGGKIQSVGSEAEVMRFRGIGTRVIDLKGRLLLPGFIDSH